MIDEQNSKKLNKVHTKEALWTQARTHGHKTGPENREHKTDVGKGENTG